MLINQSIKAHPTSYSMCAGGFSLETRQSKGENHRTSLSGAEFESGWFYSCTPQHNDDLTMQIMCKGEDLIIVVQVME
jgi:hypothetical protein